MEERKDKSLFFLNTAGISAVEFFWGLGLPLVLESTFLQLFLNRLGASNLLIGVIPTVFFTLQAFLGLFAAYQARKLQKTRALVIIYHIIPSVVIMAFGFYLLIAGQFYPSTIVIFFIAYSIFSAGIGIILPVWQNYIVKLFKSSQVLPAFSVMMILQSAGRLISSFLIAGYFDKKDITAPNSSLLFILCGLFFLIGSFGFLMTKEPEIPVSKKDAASGFHIYIRSSFRKLLSNKNLLFFIFGDIEMYAVISVISFYANYAVDFHGISPSVAAGVFVGINYAGQIFANIIFGTLNLFNIKTKCILSRICSITGMILLVAGSGLPAFLAASFLLGLSRAIRSLVYVPAIKIISGSRNITGYLAAAPLLMLPLAVGIPLFSGQLLDSLSLLAADAYRIVFAILGLLSFISIFLIRRVSFHAPGTAAEESES